MSNRNHWIMGGVLLLAVGVTMALTSQAQSQRPAVPATLAGQIASATKLVETDVDKVLKALGPAISARIARGEKVELPGLGTFRVVRIPEHKDLIDGRPGVIPSVNYVEFLPEKDIVNASNAANAVPEETVQPFKYNPLQHQTPGQKDGGTRAPNTRIR